MKIEVLVAAMNQSDLSLYDRLELGCDVVIANQCGRWDMQTKEYGEVRCRMISSDTIGVGTNRNLALEIAQGDILLFADDDMIYYDSDLHGVIEAFEKHPDADMILFGLDYTKKGEVFDRRRCSDKRRRLWNSLGFGACRTAIRRDAVMKNGLRFSTLFGGGCIYGSGEDTLFTRTCFRKGLKVYSDSYTLGKTAKDSSTWFKGFNDKLIFDKGAWLAAAFPKMKHMVKLYFAYRFSKLAKISFFETLRYLNMGIKAFDAPGGCRTFDEMR